MGLEFRGLRLGGAGRQVEVDGACFGGHVRPENRKEDRKDRRLAGNKSGKRKVVVVIRERALAGTSLGGTLPAVFASGDAAIDFIKARVDRATTVHADEAAAWNALHARFDTRRINHSVEYANDDACGVDDWRGGSRFRGVAVGRRLSQCAGASFRTVAPFP